MASRKTIRGIIDRFNREWNIDIEIHKIHLWNDDSSAEYSWKGDRTTISLCPDQKVEDLKEDIFHELGHAILHQYKVPRSALRVFHKQTPRLNSSSSLRKMEKEIPPPSNFVSWYAQVNGSEDFCETFSAWVTNDYKLKGKIVYKDWVSDLGKESVLVDKFLAVKKVLERLEKDS